MAIPDGLTGTAVRPQGCGRLQMRRSQEGEDARMDNLRDVYPRATTLRRRADSAI